MPTATRLCPMCGAELSVGGIDCLACGEKFPEADFAPPEPPRRIRWRIIPTALLSLFSGIMILGGIIAIPMHLYVKVVLPHHRLEPPLSLAVGWLIAGIFWILAARWCWQKRWIPFTVAFVLGYAIVGIVAATLPQR